MPIIINWQLMTIIYNFKLTIFDSPSSKWKILENSIQSKIDIFDQNALFFQFFLHFRHSKLILNKRKSCWSNLVTSGQIAKTGRIGQIWSKMILGQMVDFRAFIILYKSDQNGPFTLQKKIFGPIGPVVRPLRSWPKHWT